MKTAIVNVNDYSIASIYDGAPNQANYGGPWGRPEEFEHVSFDEVVLDVDMIKAEDQAGTTVVVSDPAKAQNVRNMKLSLLRSQRDIKYAKADVEIRMHDDGDVNKVATLADWQAYRIALRNTTDAYKDVDPTQGTVALDAFAKDLSDFVWPVEPA